MAYDAGRFTERYGLTLPVELGEGWRIVAIDSDRVRSALTLRLARADDEVLAFVERRQGAECFATTGQLALSYYTRDDTDHAAAAAALRALATRLTAAEAERDVTDALVVDESSATGRARTLELRINRECNEECVFCNTPEDSDTILPGREAVLAAVRSERAAGYQDITFTGREPTLDPALPEYLEAARDAGYRTIRVQTNGSSFSHLPTLERLVEAGMNTAEISLHTLEPETFRSLVGAPRLLDKTLAGLEHLATMPERVDVHLVVVLTKLNLAHAPAVIERAVTIHPHLMLITLSPMAPVGDGSARVELIPEPRTLTEPLRRAFTTARQNRVELRVPSRCGAPLCVMPAGTERFNAELDNAPGRTLEAGKSKPPQCTSCVYEPRCTGLWSACLERWGDDVVSPVRTEA